MLTIETFKAYWEKQFPTVQLHRGQFLLAVSGGVDSIVLAHLMHALKSHIVIAHVNFQLRGAESTRDENFVRDFAKQLQVPFELYHSETNEYANKHKLGIQEAAREIRYDWFKLLMDKMSLEAAPIYLLTAHHANDNVETILMQLFRGTGLHGLTGIPAQRNDELNLVRPLLGFSKADIIEYANANGLTYVEDSSNEKDDYTRNFIRNTLLPQVANIFPKVNENILATSQKIKQAEKIVDQTIDIYWNKGMSTKKGVKSISIPYWKKVMDNDAYTYGLINQFGFNQHQIEEVYKLLNAKKGAYIASLTHQLIKWDDCILIVKLHSEKDYILIQGPDQQVVKTINGNLQIELLDNHPTFTIDTDPSIAYINADQLEWPLLCRTWENGDYFYPLGMQKKKKLNHFLGSLKLNPAIKSKISVIFSKDRLIWVVGHRIDNRFKIVKSTQKILKITCQ